MSHQVLILVGDDKYAIEREIARLKARIDAAYLLFDFHRFSSTELEAAIACARTAAFGGGPKVVVLETRSFRQWGEPDLELLECLTQLPPSTCLVFIADAIDKRLKVVKYLLGKAGGKLREFFVPPPWRTHEMSVLARQYAKEAGVRLDQEAMDYFTQAVGNDTSRLATELKKLALYAGTQRLTRAQVEQLVPNATGSSLKLAAAVRSGDARQTATELSNLFRQAEYPLAILAVLITQFRTWVWVKTALEAGLTNQKTAQIAGLGNPKRMYYLRQETKGIERAHFLLALEKLLVLEVRLKGGAKPDIMLSVLLEITCLLKSH